MCKIIIRLDSVDKVKRFVSIVGGVEDDFDLVSDNHFVIDAKSIMGIFSLDLSKPVTLVSETFPQDKAEVLFRDFKKTSR